MEEKNLQKSSPGHGEPQPPLSDWLRLALDDLKMVAAAALVDERPSHTLQATALISEFWLRIADREDLAFKSREEFLGYATKAIRNILVDYGRRRNALCRGGGGGRGQVQSLDSQQLARMTPAAAKHEEALVVANLLERLHVVNSRAAQVAEMRYFSEMEHEAIGRLLGMSDRTVRKHWKAAKAWLAAEMADEPELASLDR